MSERSSQHPRRLVRLWYFVRDGLPSTGRYRRYIVAIAPFLIAIWALVASYIILAPVTYKSSMTLILPGSGVGGMLSLETIGQASSQTSSAFSSPSLSPTQKYKRLLTADLTLDSGARLLDDGSDRLHVKHAQPNNRKFACVVNHVVARQCSVIANNLHLESITWREPVSIVF